MKINRHEHGPKKPIDVKKARNGAETLKNISSAIHAAREEYKTTGIPLVTISGNNGKMGAIPSISTPPVFSCPAICGTTCAPDCYALAMLIRTGSEDGTIVKSWARNFIAYKENPDYYFGQIDLVQKINRFFRYHVSGDIIDAKYFQRMIDVARENPGCKSLAFTKQYKIVNDWIAANGGNRDALPENLQIIFSGGWGIDIPNPYGLPESYCYGKNEEFRPEWLTCGNDCEYCACRGLGCWNAKTGDVIAFAKH